MVCAWPAHGARFVASGCRRLDDRLVAMGGSGRIGAWFFVCCGSVSRGVLTRLVPQEARRDVVFPAVRRSRRFGVHLWSDSRLPGSVPRQGAATVISLARRSPGESSNLPGGRKSVEPNFLSHLA
jgi:hypothetical protein